MSHAPIFQSEAEFSSFCETAEIAYNEQKEEILAFTLKLLKKYKPKDEARTEK